MTDEQLNFRQDYRARIAGWYNGYVHIAVIYVIGGTAAMGHIYSQQYFMGQVMHHHMLWSGMRFAIPIVIFLCNIFEWFLHKEVMHQHIRKRLRAPEYAAPTSAHHNSLMMEVNMNLTFPIAFGRHLLNGYSATHAWKYQVGLSIVVLLLGVLMYIWEADQGNVQLSWIVIGLSVFMVFAMWIFPETGQTREDQKEPD